MDSKTLQYLKDLVKVKPVDEYKYLNKGDIVINISDLEDLLNEIDRLNKIINKPKVFED